jgi:hypothetical protein
MTVEIEVLYTKKEEQGNPVTSGWISIVKDFTRYGFL